MIKTAYREDIRYRGVLSYRWLKIIALLTMTLSAAASIVYMVTQLIGENDSRAMLGFFYDLLPILVTLGQTTFPLLLVCTFSAIIRKRERIRKTMLTYFLATVLFYLFVVILLRPLLLILVLGTYEALPEILMNSSNLMQYFLEIVQKSLNDGNAPALIVQLLGDKVYTVAGTMAPLQKIIEKLGPDNLRKLVDAFQPQVVDAAPALAEQLAKMLLTNIGNANVFLDLFLCSVFYFFAAYQPKKLKGGKKLIFRLCAALPVEYVFLSVVLNGLVKLGNIQLPLEVMALLTYRKPAAFMLFLAMVVYLKFREHEGFSQGLTMDEILRQRATNRASLDMSLFLSMTLFAISLCEFGLSFVPWMLKWGLGASYWMFLAVPLIMLYSFNRKHKHAWPDKLIPLYYVFHYFAVAALLTVIFTTGFNVLFTVMPK